MAMDHGAIEASFATGRNSDILVTPDFRILIAGPGAAEVKVRLGQHGDTCVDNAGINAPYVVVTSVFDGGAYRVQPGQRVMFQHGSLHEVVDQEENPAAARRLSPLKANEFPLAQSEGLAPLAKPAPSAPNPNPGSAPMVEPLVYKSAENAPQPAAETPPANASANPPATPTAAPQALKKKSGFFSVIGRFFRRLFGAE